MPRLDNNYLFTETRLVLTEAHVTAVLASETLTKSEYTRFTPMYLYTNINPDTYFVILNVVLRLRFAAMSSYPRYIMCKSQTRNINIF